MKKINKDKIKLKERLFELEKQKEIIKNKLKSINEIEPIVKKGRKIITKKLLDLKPYLK